MTKLTTEECLEWLDDKLLECQFRGSSSIPRAIRAKLIAADEMAKALAAYTGGKPPYPIEYWTHAQCDEMARKALTKWREASGEKE